MSIADNVNLLSMGHGSVFVTHRRQSLIDFKFIREYLCSLFNIISHNRHNSIALDIINRANFQLPAALNHSEHRRFIGGTAPARTVMNFTAKVRLVNFHFAVKLSEVFTQHGTNLLAHSPSGLIRNASCALNLLGRNPAACLRHEINHIEPNGEGSWGLVEDRTSGGRELPATVITAINLTLGNAVKLLIASAILTLDYFGEPLVTKIIKTSIVVRKHLLKVLESEFGHRAFLVAHLYPYLLILRMYLRKVVTDNPILSQVFRVVKGYSPKSKLYEIKELSSPRKFASPIYFIDQPPIDLCHQFWLDVMHGQRD